ncbi:MAG TPA: cbb3-type cytochrome c oxidase N-terminal domain-containing protein [Bacteroidales bacterium]|nr:cbb3-type cytochrome c oxidase N-terminal domain-containing protein [Bacteroidales bacterium]
MSQEENNKEMDPTKVVSEIKEEENSLLLPHDFDGIKELDNPAPRWLMYLLYFTIFFSAVYWVHYISFKQGPSQEEEYALEILLN